MRLATILIALLLAYKAHAKAVFAHFMVGNVASWTTSNWESDIALAQEAHIDAFALNIAYNDSTVANSVSIAFEAAQAKSFKLFFSFDYAGGGAWPQEDVLNYLVEYKSNSAYFYTDAGQPFVSTFEGPSSSADWTEIKAQTGCFFVPDWSSLGAGPALDLDEADGLFNWNAWPWGNEDSTTYVDAAYREVLGNASAGGKPYMMPVSPWFFTNMPGYDKNWLWRGDDLWFDRWQQVMYVQPEYVEIISWNDFGECHYIGPLHDEEYGAFAAANGTAPYNYVTDFPHDGWRQTLPFVIDTYKTGTATVTEEVLTVWSRTGPANGSCSTNGTTGNTASQLQIEFEPGAVAQDKIFYSALLVSPPEFIIVTIGSTVIYGDWSHTPNSDVGIYHGSVSFEGHTGEVEVVLERNSVQLATIELAGIFDTCTDNIQNWNAYVGAKIIGSVSFDNVASIDGYTCIEGTSVPSFADLCEFTCALGYCPIGACLCTAMGPSPTQPDSTGVSGYPAADMNHAYDGLCNVACNLGYCPSTYCTTVSVAVPTPTVSPFEPNVCTSGTGDGDFKDLCEYTCKVGYCPIAMCTCLTTGSLNPPVAANEDKGYYLPVLGNIAYNDICTFVCSREYCISPCSTQNPSTAVCTSGSGDGNYGGLCSYSCSYGFCPEPCTCLTKGAQVTPPTVDNTIIGYAALNLDDATYGPLCNFTCTHGYCPAGGCFEEDTINPSETISDTSVPGLISYTSPSANYSDGDFFTYVSSEDADYSLDVILIGGTSTLEDITCDVVVSGDHGSALGCIAEAVEFLVSSILDDTYALATRDSTSDYYFNVNPDWETLGNCSTHCMLLAGAPLHSWTPVGNGTYNGVYHELHFLNTGNTIGYKALQNSSMSDLSGGKVLGSRGIGGLDVSMYFTPGDIANFKDLGVDLPNPKKRISDLYALGAEETAIYGYLDHCDFFKYEGNVEAFGATVINFGSVSTFSSEDADNSLSNCTTEENASREYVIWPEDDLDTDSVSALLATFPDANVVEHVSVNGWGMLYWTASLTPIQLAQVTANKEVEEVEAKCTDDCEDPSLGFDRNDTFSFNQTASRQLKKRDRGFTTQVKTLTADISPDLCFVSQPRNTELVEQYKYDLTAGEDVFIYILDSEGFDLTLAEFQSTDSVLLSIASKAANPTVVGPDGYIVPQPWNSHGTSMLAQVAGATLGVAKNVWPVLYNFAREDGRHWVIDSLDKIYKDFEDKNPTQLNNALAPLGVLSMSFGYHSTGIGGFARKWARWLQKLVDLGILPVAAAGNGGVQIHMAPAIFGDPNLANYVPGLLTIGGVDSDGSVWEYSDTASWLSLYAPAVEYYSPFKRADGTQDFYSANGTSGACAKTAALAAYFTGLSSLKDNLTSVLNLKAHILTESWARIAVDCIYNSAPA